MEQLNFAQK